MLVQYQNLTIRNALPEDASVLAFWWNDGSVMAHAGFPLGLGITAEQIASSLQQDTDETRRRLILEVDSVPIGEMNYQNLMEGSAEIGIKICVASRQNKGLGTTFLQMLIRKLFSIGYSKIVLDTNLNNHRAQHTYEKLGFRKIRIRENSWQDQLGVWQSAVDYVLLPEDFRCDLPVL